MFPYGSISQPVYNERNEITGYKYLDGEIIKILAEKMNFTPIYFNKECCFGSLLPNGSFSKDLGALERGEVDISGVQTITLDYNTKKSLFLNPIYYRKLFFLVPSPETKKEFLVSLINSFDVMSNIFITISVMIYPIILYFIHKIEKKFHKLIARKPFGDCVLEINCIMINCPIQFPRTTSSRTFFATVMLHALIQTAILQGMIIKILNSNIVIGKIDTLDQLSNSNLEIYLDEADSMIFKNADGSPIARKLKQISMKPKKNLTSLDSVAFLLGESDISRFLE